MVGWPPLLYASPSHTKERKERGRCVKNARERVLASLPQVAAAFSADRYLLEESNEESAHDL